MTPFLLQKKTRQAAWVLLAGVACSWIGRGAGWLNLQALGTLICCAGLGFLAGLASREWSTRRPPRR